MFSQLLQAIVNTATDDDDYDDYKYRIIIIIIIIMAAVKAKLTKQQEKCRTVRRSFGHQESK